MSTTHTVASGDIVFHTICLERKDRGSRRELWRMEQEANVEMTTTVRLGPQVAVLLGTAEVMIRVGNGMEVLGHQPIPSLAANNQIG